MNFGKTLHNLLGADGKVISSMNLRVDRHKPITI